jgi:hypothetical protein
MGITGREKILEGQSWLSYLTAFGAIATPVLVLALAVVGWKLRQSIDLRLKQENRMAQDRFDTYNIILEPFALLLMTQAAWEREGQNREKSKSEAALARLLSSDYRNAAFRLSMIANDDVVLAYNALIQFFSSQGGQPASSGEKLKAVLGLLGQLLLEIRKSMGHQATRLDHWQMLEWFMTDVRKIRNA